MFRGMQKGPIIFLFRPNLRGTSDNTCSLSPGLMPVLSLLLPSRLHFEHNFEKTSKRKAIWGCGCNRSDLDYMAPVYKSFKETAEQTIVLFGLAFLA